MKEEQSPYLAHLYRRRRQIKKQNTKNDTKSHTLLFISHYKLVRYESSCGHKIKEFTPKQIGDEHGRGKKQNQIRQTNREESRQKEAGVEVA